MTKQDALWDIEREVRTVVHRVRRMSIENAQTIDPQLSAPAFSVLFFIFDNGTVRAQDVVEAFGVDKATVSRQIAQLEELGLVSRSIDPHDGRAQSVSLTDVGQERVDTLAKQRRSDFIERLSDWSAEDLEQLAEFLARYNASLEP
ncbi:MarR family transcriptional regulator [Aeromicrobium panaciterrae]|uniref:MarR family winged helix-turn-helix transcriptional regulator n=1 Tax=Aeromicrobium panaciterrae TaxID=363861 RepID=UPI0031DC5833